MSKYSSFCNALSSTQYSLPMSSTSFAVLLSALPHCRIFSKSTATREWLTCILDILQLRKTFCKEKNCAETVKPKFSMDTLNDNVDNAKSCRWKRLILQFAAKTNFPREYFLAADRGNHIIKGHKLSSVCFSFKSSAFRRSFFWRRFVWESVFQVKFQVHGKVESASVKSRISEQISCKQKLCKFVVHLVTSNQRF